MKLADYIQPELVLFNLESTDKWELIGLMASLLAKSGKISDEKQLGAAMLEREKTMTTGLGHGIAIPHAMSDCVESIVVAAAILEHPLDFESLDLQPISIVFAIATPVDRDKRYMMLLSEIARLFSNHEFTERLFSAKNADEFIEIICES